MRQGSIAFSSQETILVSIVSFVNWPQSVGFPVTLAP
jgi:hypothetical protein